MRKISRIEITNYRGIAERKIDVPEGGFTAKGRNGGGKTSILKALRSALAAQGIGPDAIRDGADKAEILLNMGDITVRRVITAKQSSVTVKHGDMVAGKPQHYLDEMFGTAPLDPLNLMLAKPKEQRAMIVEALPSVMTIEGLRKYAPTIPDDFDMNGHGLEVVERARKMYYDARTEANRVAKEAERAATAADAAASRAVPDTGLSASATSLEVEAARSALVAIHQRKQDAEAASERMKSTTERVEKMREEAAMLLSARGEPLDVKALEQAEEDADAEVRRLRQLLTEALERAKVAEQKHLDARKAHEAWTSMGVRAGELRVQSDELAKAVAAVSAPPTDDELAAAQAEWETKAKALESAKAEEEGRLLREKSAEAAALRKKTLLEANRLDGIVNALTDQAPADLLATSGGYPGLTIVGDSVLLNGHKLEDLCGAEQMKFAIDIARSLNAKPKLLIVDGLERLDPDQIDAFVKYATRDGFQLIGTRVDRGEVVIEAIAAEEAEAAE